MAWFIDEIRAYFADEFVDGLCGRGGPGDQMGAIATILTAFCVVGIPVAIVVLLVLEALN